MSVRAAVRAPYCPALLALILLAAVLRFTTLGVQSFDFDEAVTVHRVLDGSLGHVFHQLPRSESNPPLYYVLAWLWTRAFGLGEFGARSPSALAGTALVPIVYAAGRELVSRRAGLVASGLAAVNPLLIYYSQEARNYSLLTLLAAVGFWAFARALADPSTRRLGGWALASALALLTHYFAVFAVVPEAALLLLGARSRLGAGVAAAVPAMVGGALLPLALDQADGRTEWISGQSLGTRAHQVVSKFVVGEIDPIGNAPLLLVAIGAAAVAAFAARRASPRELRGAALAAGVVAGALALPLALDLVGLHYLLARNVIAALPVALVAAGALLGTAGAAPLAPLTATGLGALSLAVVVAAPFDERLQRADYRAAAASVGSVPRDAALVAPSLGSVPLEYYLPGATEATGVLRLRLVELVEPVSRRDSAQPPRPATPMPPPGFALARREDGEGFTRIVFAARRSASIATDALRALAPPGPAGEPPVVLTWPRRMRSRSCSGSFAIRLRAR
jgi:mannosyltransferase